MTVLIDGVEYSPSDTGKASIGIGITTFNRNDLIKETYKKIKKYSPNAKIVIVDDCSTVPVEVEGATVYRFDQNVGIARAKNKCLELLDDCDHIFLFDDDTYPIKRGWYKPYIDSPEPHLMYMFKDLAGPSKLNDIGVIHQDDKHIAYTGPRGVMLYVDRKVLDVVGGMDKVYGKWGWEHGDWSNRIHHAGLTSWRYADVIASDELIHSMDEHEEVESTTSSYDRQTYAQQNSTLHNSRRRDRYEGYCEYRERRNVVITCLYGKNEDPQRPGNTMSTEMLNALTDSVTGADMVVYSDLVEFDHSEFIKDDLHGENIFFKRWLNVYQYLRAHKEVEWAAAVDGTDVVMQKEPWDELSNNTLYVGYEPKIIDNQWLKDNHPDPSVQEFIETYPSNQLLNAGVVMGDRKTVMSFAHKMVMHYYDRQLNRFLYIDNGGDDLGDMGAFNVEAHQFNPVWGSAITTLFKYNEINNFSYWRHK